MNWDENNPPDFPRPFKDKTWSELIEIIDSLPYDYRMSSRINWENRVVYAYAEIGYRMRGSNNVVIGFPSRTEEFEYDNHND